MQLIYTDESGVNYSNTKGLFKDGPYIFYGGICVDENKYFHLERMFVDLIKEYFSIDDWRAEEIHASNMWNLKGYFSKFKQENIREFFEELIQLLIKLQIQTIIGCQKKSLNATSEQQVLEEAYSIYSFLHAVELYLSIKSDTGLIIADQKQGLNNHNSTFSKLFYERSKWRTNPDATDKSLIKSKFKYESRLCFLLDNIHYVNSHESLFNQIIDIVLFLVMRVWTYQNLRVTNIVPADISKLPIGVQTFRFFSGRILEISRFDEKLNDVIFDDIEDAIKFGDRSSREIFTDQFFSKRYL